MLKKVDIQPESVKTISIIPWLCYRGNVHVVESLGILFHCSSTGSDDDHARHIRDSGVETLQKSFINEQKKEYPCAEVIRCNSSDVPADYKDSIPVEVLAAFDISRSSLDEETFEFFFPLAGNHRIMAIQTGQRDQVDPLVFPYNLMVNVVLVSKLPPVNALLYEGKENDIWQIKVKYIVFRIIRVVSHTHIQVSKSFFDEMHFAQCLKESMNACTKFDAFKKGSRRELPAVFIATQWALSQKPKGGKLSVKTFENKMSACKNVQAPILWNFLKAHNKSLPVANMVDPLSIHIVSCSVSFMFILSSYVLTFCFTGFQQLKA